MAIVTKNVNSVVVPSFLFEVSTCPSRTKFYKVVSRTSRFHDPPEKVLIPWGGGRYVIIMSGDLEANKTSKLIII
ncbi:hypothetical protein P5673_021001 [Acropora cervicornis]|uniref:Uncharacterized protein n=1 Tax=Acropora cervicornis TaxID=6130 RepID=A0AAD9Q8Q1_ACRCE|nr:hypothetical protein P5673_021001 [Acropora cervicornis]